MGEICAESVRLSTTGSFCVYQAWPAFSEADHSVIDNLLKSN